MTYQEDCAARWNELAERFISTINEHEERAGELPKRPQPELDALKMQVEQARAAKQAAKDSLITLKADKQTLKTNLQTQLAAATDKDVKAALKDVKAALRGQIDDCVAAIDQATKQLADANAALDSLRAEKDELLYQERITQGKTTIDDEPRLRADKQRQAEDVADKRAWLAKRGK